jgi:hypothetical protein
MKDETEVWQLMTHDGIYQADLPTLKQWVAEGVVLPTDRVRKGALKWIEAQRAPSLRRVFTGEEVPEPAPEAAPSAQHVPQHAHTPQGQSHTHAATPADAETEAEHAQDLGLKAEAGAAAQPFALVPPDGFADAPNGFIEVVSSRDFGSAPHATGAEPGGEPSLGSACSNHPAEGATLICRSCRATFCRACPNRMGTSSVLLCPACGNFCDQLESITECVSLYERAGSGFGFEDFTEALAYPLKHLGSLIGGALLYGFLLIVGLRGQLLASALVFGCISLVIHRVAYGRMDRDFLPDFSEFSFWDDVLVPCFLGLGITLVTLGPVLLLIAVLIFGLFSGGGAKSTPIEAARQQTQQQGMTADDMKALANGGTPEQEAELDRKIKQMSPAGQLSRQVEASKPKEDTTFTLVRALFARPGLVILLALVALAWAVFYHPMALLVAGWTESFKATINPLVGLDTMRHMGANYFKAFAMYLVVQVASFTLYAVVSFVTSPFDMPFVGNIPARFIGGVVTFYASLVIACVLGLSLFKSADRLGIELD